MAQSEVKNSIPFVKPVRVGNFKLWRSKTVIGKGKDKLDIEAINVSNLDGTWSVRIPATFEMFGMIVAAYQWYNSDNDEEKKRGEDYLFTVFSNMMYVSSVCNGFYHRGVQMVSTVYAYPDVLRDKKKFKSLKKEAEGTIKRFLEWRKDYDEYLRSLEPSGKELMQDEIAEKAMNILNVNDDDGDREAS